MARPRFQPSRQQLASSIGINPPQGYSSDLGSSALGVSLMKKHLHLRRPGQAAPVQLPAQRAAQPQPLSTVLSYLHQIHGLQLITGTVRLQVLHSAITQFVAGILCAYPVFKYTRRSTLLALPPLPETMNV